MPDSEWLTWEQAAALVGCPIPTIDWHKRMGRIRYRPQRPSLERASVEEFGRWWSARRAERAGQEARRALGLERNRREPPEPTGWLSTSQAAAEIGCSAHHATRLARAGTLTAQKTGGRLWIRQDAVEYYLERKRGWVSYATASRMVGCSPSTLQRAVARGEVVARQAESTAAPCLSRSSVERFAGAWAARQEQREQARASAKVSATAAPADGQVWLDTTTAALILGMTANRLGQLAREGRVPHRDRGARRWFRRQDIEQLAAVRVSAHVTRGATLSVRCLAAELGAITDRGNDEDEVAGPCHKNSEPEREIVGHLDTND